MKTPKRPILVLVDGSAVFHRGFHAIPHLSNSAGEPTNAIYGFVTILLKVLADLQPAYMIVAWDKSSKTFRKDMYPEYKATRTAMPPELRAQIEPTKELVQTLRLPFIEVENYEADDIIGTLARKAEATGELDVVIATGDRDQLQLIDEHTVVDLFNPRGLEPTRYDLAKMIDKYGLTPTQFIDYKAIVGDSSDNIPGVKGIGDKGAQKLLADYKTLEGVYQHADEVAGKMGEYLRSSKDIAFLSRQLSEIVCDMPIELDLDAAKVGQYDQEEVHKLFARFDFRSSLLSKLNDAHNGEKAQLQAVQKDIETTKTEVKTGVSGQAQSLFSGVTLGGQTDTEKPRRDHLQKADYQMISTPKELQKLMEQVRQQKVIAIDTETTSVDVTVAKLVGVSLCWQSGVAYYIPVGHTAGDQLSWQEVKEQLLSELERADLVKVGHNIKYDYQVLRRHGVTLGPIGFDTMVANFLLNPLGRAQSLDDLAFRELAVDMIPITELIGTGKNQTSFADVPVAEATTYAAEDADMTWRLYEILSERLAKKTDKTPQGWSMKRLADDIEWPIIPVLGEMELDGILLDTKVLQTYGKKLDERLAQLKQQIFDLAGEEFNLNSPAQLGQILYGRLGLSSAGLKKGKNGGFTTAVDALEKLRDAHPMIPLLMEFRELDKLTNTYVKALPEMVREDGRIHTSFSQVIAQTGRLSSSNPNLQNIPVRTDAGREIRRSFVASSGHKLVTADYSQIELRVAAALANDAEMIKTFREGADLHQQTAALLYGVAMDAVTKNMRNAAKTINFGVLYGMSAHGLSVATGMDGKEAVAFIEKYFEVRPKLRQYIADIKTFAYQNDFTETMFGRRRPCPEVHSSNFNIRSGAERVAVNVPIQGTAADIYKLAMIELAGRLDNDCRLLLQIHDELIVETPTAKAEAVAALMREVMEGVIDIGVPLAVDTAIGDNWGELK
ncbi:DNA polymerase I [bacterium]|nr:MAG: DNA polymerase I [bacterium]